MFIVATISKNSYEPEKIKEIIEAGASILRFNFSHGTPDEMISRVKVAKKVILDLGKDETVKIMADLPGNKLRLGKFEPFDYLVNIGQEIIFKSSKESKDPNEFIPVNVEEIGKLVKVNQEISVADGSPRFSVKEILSNDSFKAVVLNNGLIPNQKGLNVGQGVDFLDHITNEFLAHADVLLKIKPDFIALSFVNSLDYLKKAKMILKEKMGIKKLPLLVAKIETEKGVKYVDEIAKMLMS